MKSNHATPALRRDDRRRPLVAILVALAALASLLLTLTTDCVLVRSAAHHGAAPTGTDHHAAAKCRVVGVRVALGLHHPRALRDGSASTVHERATGKASLVEDIDETSHAVGDRLLDGIGGLRAGACVASSGSRPGGVADPSRFAASSGLPRGPPV